MLFVFASPGTIVSMWVPSTIVNLHTNSLRTRLIVILHGMRGICGITRFHPSEGIGDSPRDRDNTNQALRLTW